MNLTRRLTLSAAVLGSSIALASQASAVNILVNGDFATNDITGWTTTGAAGIVDASSGAAVFAGGGAPDGNLTQAFTPQVTPVTLYFEFVNSDPVGTDRATNFFFAGAGGQINMRVRPGGDLQIFQSGGPSWQNIFPDGTATNDGSTVNTLSLTVNGVGGGWDYDVTVNGNTVTGLSFFQNATPTDIDRIVFTNDFGATAFTVDNVSVDAIPEPSGVMLLGLGALGLAARRRR